MSAINEPREMLQFAKQNKKKTERKEAKNVKHKT